MKDELDLAILASLSEIEKPHRSYATKEKMVEAFVKDVRPRLITLHHQLILDERQRLIGVVEKEMNEWKKLGEDKYAASLNALLTTLNKEKD